MSGHSKWSTIKRKKGANDAKRGALFTKMVKLISAAVKTGGGGDIEQNYKLKLAIDKAKSVNMPISNIENAIKKATGQTDDSEITYEITYEGYAPEGVAIIVQALTDNKNRTAAEVRHIFSKNGGNLGETGCVGWMFHPKGMIEIISPKDQQEKHTLMIIEAPGVEDIEPDTDRLIITTALENYQEVKTFCQENQLTIDNSQTTMIPENTINIDNLQTAQKILKLIESLEDNDDIQEVYANFEIDDQLATKLA